MTDDMVPANNYPMPQDDDPSSALDGVELRLPLVKHAFQTGLFSIPRSGAHRESLCGALIKLRGKVRRLYEARYEEGQPAKPPDCFSLNGVQGSREAVVREFTQKGAQVQRAVFGRCAECFFNKFGTADGCSGPGKACGEYGFALILDGCDADGRNGVPFLIQLPPTASGIGSDIGEISLANHLIPEKILWEFSPKGGGKSKKAISVKPLQGRGKGIETLTPEGLVRIRAYQQSLGPIFEAYVNRFVAGQEADEDYSHSAGY